MNTNMIYRIQLLGLPRVLFAHPFSAETYQNNLAIHEPPHTMLEVTYVAAGELCFSLPDGMTRTAVEGSVICNPYSVPLRVQATAPHEHRTVGCRVPFRLLSPDESTDEKGISEEPSADDPSASDPSASDPTADGAPFGTLCLPFLTPPSGESHPSRSIPLCIDELIAAHTMHTKGSIFCAGLFLQLLERLDDHSRAPRTPPAYHHRKYVKQAKQYIFEHLREPIRQTDIAAHLGISPEYLCSVFKQTEGVPVIRFVNRIKLEQIRTLMQSSRLTLAEASERYGYTDPNYVSRLHKRYFGCNITEPTQRPPDEES